MSGWSVPGSIFPEDITDCKKPPKQKRKYFQDIQADTSNIVNIGVINLREGNDKISGKRKIKYLGAEASLGWIHRITRREEDFDVERTAYFIEITKNQSETKKAAKKKVTPS